MNDEYAVPRKAFKVVFNTIGNVLLIASSPFWVIPLLVFLVWAQKRNIFTEQLW
jgi:hypothetical protein